MTNEKIERMKREDPEFRRYLELNPTILMETISSTAGTIQTTNQEHGYGHITVERL